MEKSVKVFVEGKARKVRAAPRGERIRDLMKKFGVVNETVMMRKNGKVAHPDDAVRGGDVVEFLVIVSRG